MRQDGAVGGEQLAAPRHEGGALADAQMLEQKLDRLDLVAGDFDDLLLRLEEHGHVRYFKRQRLIHTAPLVGMRPAGRLQSCLLYTS